MPINRNLALRCIVKGVALVLLAGATPAIAGVAISPVSVELSPTQRVAQITLSNTGPAPIVIQADAAVWSQVDNADRYDKTDALLVAPAIVEVPARSAQVFRVGLRGAFPKSGERTFRLYLEDITEPTKGSGLSLRIRHDLPVMIAGPTPGKALPRLRACEANAAVACVRLDNEGDRRVKITSLTVEGEGWRKEIKTPVVVLAGAWKQWTFDTGPTSSGSVKAIAETSVGTLSADLPRSRH